MADAISPLPVGGNAATIRIAEDAHPKDLGRPESESRFRPLARTDTSALAGGIYNTRVLSRTASRASFDRRRSADWGGGDGEEGDNWRDSEKPKVKPVYRGTTLLWLAYQSVGAIYGDIGTSPLYVYSSTFTSSPSHETLLQVLSLVLWSLTVMVTFKYILIVLRADNEGEGGTFSCYSLLTRFVSFLFLPRGTLLSKDRSPDHAVNNDRPTSPSATRANNNWSVWSANSPAMCVLRSAAFAPC